MRPVFNSQSSRFVMPVLVLIFASFVFFVSYVPAQDAATTQVTEFDVNGLKVLVKRRPGTPTVAGGLFFRGGSRNMTPANAGIEKLTLAVATEASKNFPRATLRKELSSKGTLLSSGTNPDYSALSLVSTKQAFDSAWRIFTDVALNPTFAPEDVTRIRDVMLTGIRSRTDTPEGLLEDVKDRVVYAGHPYLNSQDGSVETVSKFKPSDLADYHRTLMQTTRMLLVIVGDVEPEVIRQRAADAFGRLPRGDDKGTLAPALLFTQGTVDVTPKQTETDYVKGVFGAPSLRDADYYAMRVATTLLQTAVFQEVRVRRNLSYAPDAELDAHAANTASISVTSKNPTEAVAVMLAEIHKLRTAPVPEDELARMAGFFLTTYYLKQETSAAQAGELAQWELIGGGWRNSLTFLDKMRSVKPADIQAVANKYMRNIRFVVVGNPSDIRKEAFLLNSGD